MTHYLSVRLHLLLLAGAAVAAQAAPVSVTPMPSVQGPVAVTASSYPFARARNVDLEGAGYVEEEYFVSGKANVYEWNAAGTGAAVRSAGAPYTTRILVIRPRDARRFNSRVMVDILNMTNGWDFNKMWAVMHDHLLANGWAYVGVTSKPNTVRALKVFDPRRYAALEWKNPLPLADARNCENVPVDSARDTENGLVWDILSQIGVALRSGSRTGPLRGLKPERVYLVGYSQSSFFLNTYLAAIHPLARREGGKPVWDGYLLSGGPSIGVQTPINQCAPNLPADDPRRVTRASDVPVIDVIGAMDVGGMLATYLSRRDDADAPDDLFRLYEVPGASHSWLYQLPFNSSAADVKRSGFDNYADRVPATCTMGQPNDLPMHYVLDASLDNLDRWATTGEPAPRAERLRTETVDGKPRFLLDADGNQLGGYRLPQVDVPLGAYVPTNSNFMQGSGCWSWSHFVPFSREKLLALYPTQDAYVSKVAQRAAELVRARVLTVDDARRTVQAAAARPVP
jgi:hypothetical protein